MLLKQNVSPAKIPVHAAFVGEGTENVTSAAPWAKTDHGIGGRCVVQIRRPDHICARRTHRPEYNDNMSIPDGHSEKSIPPEFAQGRTNQSHAIGAHSAIAGPDSPISMAARPYFSHASTDNLQWNGTNTDSRIA